MSVDLPSSPAELESLLSKAVKSRASRIREESGSLTLANVRRLIEEDLGLQTFELDPHKSLIRKLVDEVLVSLNSSEADKEENIEAQSIEEFDKTNGQNKARSKEHKKPSASEKGEEEASSASDDEISHEASKKKKRKKNIDTKAIKKVSSLKKESSDERKQSGLDASDGTDDSEDHSVEKRPKVSKCAEVKPAYSRKIEHLKKIIKACGLNVPPAIYKRVKQTPENKRESFLVKELEGILDREGLSSNPTEKEIKSVKRRRDKEKDLEGIDTSNIILEPRGRRAASGWFGPPKYVEHANEDISDEEGASESGRDESNQEDGSSDEVEENDD